MYDHGPNIPETQFREIQQMVFCNTEEDYLYNQSKLMSQRNKKHRIKAACMIFTQVLGVAGSPTACRVIQLTLQCRTMQAPSKCIICSFYYLDGRWWILSIHNKRLSISIQTSVDSHNFFAAFGDILGMIITLSGRKDNLRFGRRHMPGQIP